jgi:riboflavin kinase/FMN adenylyltransferase
MILIRNLKNLILTQPLCLTIGNFDGFHIGHQKIIKEVKNIADKNSYKSAILTFEPHPSSFFKKEQNKKFKISSIAQKLNFIKKNNLDYAIFIKFNNQLSQLSPKEFIDDILIRKLNIAHLVIGYDFVFGKNRSGDISTLLKYKDDKFDVTQIKAISINNEICSSSNIRQKIISGNINIANNLLGDYFNINSRVIMGQKIASNLGYPTANFKISDNIIKPKFGVYKTKTYIYNLKQEFNSITNYGVKPTIGNNNEIFETHIPNFSNNIYNEKISTRFIEFIRAEKKFDNIDLLKKQIEIDIKSIEK